MKKIIYLLAILISTTAYSQTCPTMQSRVDSLVACKLKVKNLSSGVLKASSIGNISIAVAGTDYSTPSSLHDSLGSYAKKASNLSDLGSASIARTNLGLGTLATQSGTFSGTSSGTNTGDQTNISGNAATVTTNANLTGPITSVGNATSVALQTGTTNTFVMSTQPTFVTDITTPIVYGSSSSGGNLQLNSTSHATKGKILFGTLGGYDIANQYYGIGTQSPAAVLHLAQSITSPGWTTNGIGLRIAAATYTDNSSSGTVATTYAHFIGAPTFASSSSVTNTNAYTLFVSSPSAGTNTTNTQSYSIGSAGNILIGGTSATFSNAGVSGFVAPNASSFKIATGSSNTNRLLISSTGLFSHAQDALSSGTTAFQIFTQAAHTGGAQPGLLWTAGAHTSQTTATEINDWNLNFSGVLKSIDGTIANMRTMRVQGRTYTPQTSALTLTKASTLSVSTPIAGSGTTITTIAAIECDGNLLMPTIGNGLIIKTGTNATLGNAVLVGGTVTVSNTKVTANTIILLSIDGVGSLANLGTPYEDKPSRVAGTSFVLKSSNILDTSTISWILIEPAP